jgi:ABC-type sugar transport system substrate-binding protein
MIKVLEGNQNKLKKFGITENELKTVTKSKYGDLILEKVASTNSDGIAIDPLDNLFDMKAISEIKKKGISIIVFDSPSPEAKISSIGNNFTLQGVVAAERLVRLIKERGKVAVPGPGWSRW